MQGCCWTVAAVCAAGWGGAPVLGIEVPKSAFSPGATVIDFNGLTGGASISTGEVITTQYLGQGVLFNNPHRLTRANANLAAPYVTNSDPNLAFVDQGSGGAPGVGPQEVIFFTPRLRAGCWYGISSNTTLTIQAYNGATLLEEVVKTGANMGGPGLEGFVGIERPEGITMIRLSSAGQQPFPYNFSIDDVVFEGTAGCYANCDLSTSAPVLNVADFTCYLTRFASGDPSANCNGSTVAPILNVADFTCFLTKFAGGCP